MATVNAVEYKRVMTTANLTSPAMSTISRNAGTSLFGWNRSHSHLNLSSGMFTRACRCTVITSQAGQSG